MPSGVPAAEREDGTVEALYPDASELPVVMVIPAFPEPAIFSGQPAPERFEGRNWIWEPEPIKNVLERFSAKSILSPRVKPALFARMIAKIAHAHGTAHLGDVFLPVLPPVILGKHRAWLDFVGGTLEPPPPDAERGHSLALFKARREFDGQDFAMAGIRLFASLEAPLHYAVLGPLIKPWPEHLTVILTEDERRNLSTMFDVQMSVDPPEAPADHHLQALP